MADQLCEEGEVVQEETYVKGKAAYVHYQGPKDYCNESCGMRYAVVPPQAFCYIDVSQPRTLDP